MSNLPLFLVPGRGPSIPLALRIGFGNPFYQDSGKSILASADGDPIAVASDSVAGNDYTQTTTGQQPFLDNYCFSKPSIQVRSIRGDYLAIPNSPLLDAQNFTMIALVARLSLSLVASTPIWWQSAGSSSGRLLSEVTYPLISDAGYWAGPNGFNGSSQITYGGHVVTLISSPSAMTLRVDGSVVATAAPASAGTMGGGYLGSLAGSYAAHGVFAGQEFYGGPLSGSALTVAEATAAAYATVGTTFNPSVASFLTIGDSLTEGTNASSDSTAWPFKMMSLMANGATYRRSLANLGIPGATIAGAGSTGWNSAAALTYVNGFYDAGRPENVGFVWLGTNDSTDGPTTYANFTALCASYKAMGCTVIAVDMLPRQDTGYTRRDSFNGLLAADFTTTYAANVKHGGATYADVLIQLSGDTTIGQAGDEDNPTYYSTDKTHLTDAGYAIVAGYGVTAMNFLGFT